ncbi:MULTISPECIES: Pycsar system effector family protein [Pseudomonas]|uniref:Pycsar system effector family protein n=1 Tax=Pseudomonas TaxID=286 RepID=UPI000F58520A|nr:MULTISPECIES: Pycsar system effector family protein [Pseudomonas]
MVDDEQKIRISGLWDNLKRYDSYISAVNFRSGLLTSFAAAVFGGVILKADQLIQASQNLKIAITVSLLGIGISSLLIIYWVIKSIWPNLTTNKHKLNKPSIFFFGSVSKNFNAKTYAETLHDIPIDEFEADLAIQVHEVAEVTLLKFSTISKAANCAKLNLLLLMILLALVLADSIGIHICAA